jgi:single-strand DNA-binding protein
MARGLNKVMLIGRIQPNDPELRYTQSGQAVCTYKMVTDESYKDREGNTVDRSEWHNIVAWGKAGEIIAQYMKKGSQMFVEGRLQSRKYEDKEGQTRYVTEIVVSDFSFLDSGGARTGEGDAAPRAAGATSARDNGSYAPAPAGGNSSPVEEDDLPF